MNTAKSNNGTGTADTTRTSFSESSMDAASALHSSSSAGSFNESSSSVNGAIRMFSSPLTNFKNKIIKKKKVPVVRKGSIVAQRRSSSSELELDNGDHLSSLMTLHAGKPPNLDIFDKSFESDFDESGRWIKQI